MITVEILSAGRRVADGYVWRSDVVLAQATSLAMPLAVRVGDGRLFDAVDLHDGDGFWALTLPDGSVTVDVDQDVPFPLPATPAPAHAAMASSRPGLERPGGEELLMPRASRSSWCRIFPRLPCC